MSRPWGPSDLQSTAASAGRGRRVVAACLLATLAVGIGLAGPALAEDTEPPSFGNTTIVNETTFEVVVEDDEGVDEGSIGESDFSLSPGRIDAMQVNESGNDSVVTVTLAQPVRSDNATLSLDGSIADDAGNELTDDSVTVAGIDGFPPFLDEYEVDWVGESTVEIAFYVDERVDDATVAVTGRESARYDENDLTETDTNAANEYRYATNHTFDAEGEYTITLERVSDVHGNAGLYFADRSVVHDGTAPAARIDGPTTSSVGRNVTFDGTESSDEYGIDAYEWAIDGNRTSTNGSFTHSFEESGRHEVELTVTDVANNTDVARLPVEVLDATTTDDVHVEATNGTGVDVTVGPNRTKERVLVERSGGLAGNGTALLDSLTLTVATNATANLSTAAVTGAPASFDEDDQTPLETFDVEHEGASASDVTFRFSVRRSALEDADVSLDGVSLYREGANWTRLPTLRVGGNDTHVQYRATSPGLSRFVIAGSDEPLDDRTNDGGRDANTGGTGDGEEAAFAVVDGRLLTTNVSAGDPLAVRATIANDGNVTGTYAAGLAVDGSVLGTTDVTIPAGETRDVTLAEPATSGGAVTVNDTRVGAVIVGDGPGVTGGDDGGGGIDVPIPNPLALWPGGLVGRVLGAIFWLGVVVYGILKGLAIYLGY